MHHARREKPAGFFVSEPFCRTNAKKYFWRFFIVFCCVFYVICRKFTYDKMMTQVILQNARNSLGNTRANNPTPWMCERKTALNKRVAFVRDAHKYGFNKYKSRIIMEKFSKLSVFALGVLLFLTSCQDDMDKALTPESDHAEEMVTYDIALIRDANKPEVDLTSHFLASSSQYGKTHFNFGDDFISQDVVEYTNLEGKAVVLTYDDEEKNEDELSLILVADEENKLITYYEHDRKDMGSTYQVTVYYEGHAWLFAEVEKSTEEVINYTIFDTKSDDDDDNGVSFFECMGAAVGACLDDPECAFLCGILWKWCLGSIALACALVAI